LISSIISFGSGHTALRVIATLGFPADALFAARFALATLFVVSQALRFDELLAEDATLARAEAEALNPVIAWQVERGMSEPRMSKSDMARALRTSRAALDRLLEAKAEGARVVVTGRSADRLKSAQALLGADARTVALDVA
jgi:antitoxin HicB